VCPAVLSGPGWLKKMKKLIFDPGFSIFAPVLKPKLANALE
jgi:hypothetical protein